MRVLNNLVENTMQNIVYEHKIQLKSNNDSVTRLFACTTLKPLFADVFYLTKKTYINVYTKLFSDSYKRKHKFHHACTIIHSARKHMFKCTHKFALDAINMTRFK